MLKCMRLYTVFEHFACRPASQHTGCRGVPNVNFTNVAQNFSLIPNHPHMCTFWNKKFLVLCKSEFYLWFFRKFLMKKLDNFFMKFFQLSNFDKRTSRDGYTQNFKRLKFFHVFLAGGGVSASLVGGWGGMVLMKIFSKLLRIFRWFRITPICIPSETKFFWSYVSRSFTCDFFENFWWKS